MYSVKIKNNIQNLFSVLDNTVPGSSPYAVNKTISNSDTNFCLNTLQSITAPSINLIQGSTSERFTVGTVVTNGTYRYHWLYSDVGNNVKRQIANISFSNGFVINSLPSNQLTTGYVSYNHPDSSVYSGLLLANNPNYSSFQIATSVTVYDINTIATAKEFTCTQIGVVFLAYANLIPFGSTIMNSLSTLINVGQTLSSVINELMTAVDGVDLNWKFNTLTEITNLSNSTTDVSGPSYAVVYSTAIFSITN